MSNTIFHYEVGGHHEPFRASLLSESEVEDLDLSEDMLAEDFVVCGEDDWLFLCMAVESLHFLPREHREALAERCEDYFGEDALGLRWRYKHLE